MTLQERIAKAIYENRNGRGCVAWAHRSSEHKRPYMEDARVAITSMQEPTEGMIKAGSNRFCQEYEAPIIWEDMVRAALEEK